MIKIGAKRGRTSSSISPVASDPVIASAVKVASSEDLVTEILLHVPVKTLMCFKSVSKQWLSIITNPRFSRLHNRLSPSVSSLFFATPSCSSNPEYQFIPCDTSGEALTPFKSLNFVLDPSGYGISVLQSCNGLLLCASYRARQFNRRYYVYNPTTKQFSTLPRTGREYSKNVCGMSLVFDPSVSPCYKVICVKRSEKSRENFQIQIYSSETLSWRVSGEPFTARRDTNFQKFIYWNGSVLWWDRFVECSFSRQTPYILYFEVFEEKIEHMSMPLRLIHPIVMDEQVVMTFRIASSYLGESEGQLHFVELHPEVPYLFNVYEMARDYSGWSVKYKFDINDISNVFTDIIEENIYSFRDTFNILFIVTSGTQSEKDGSFMVLEIPGGKVVRYYFADKQLEELWKFDSTFKKSYTYNYNYDGLRYVCALPYIQSLACV